MTKITILNVGHSNKGNCALISSTKNIIKQYISDVEFSYIGAESGILENEIINKEAGVISLSNFKLSLRSLYYLIFCIFFIRFFNKEIFSNSIINSPLYPYNNCDIFVNSGGDHLSGEYGISTISTFLNVYYAILLKKPVILFGDSLGYFKNPIMNIIAKFVLNKVKLIILRENLSKKYLDLQKINRPKIVVTSDPAFLLKPVHKEEIYDILSHEEIKNIKGCIIGFNPSALITNFMKEKKENAESRYIDLCVEIIDTLITNLNVSIILIPHVFSNKSDDRIVIRDIYKKVKFPSKVYMIQNEYSPQILKGIIGLSDLFIGSRMHAIIASTSMLVPSIGIAYSHKMHGIIGEQLNMQEYIIDIEDLSYDLLLMKVLDAWYQKEKIKIDLSIKIPIIQKLALSSGQHLLNAVKSDIK